MKINRVRLSIFILMFFWFAALCHGQINRYWSQNFNDGSSMLAGAVVGGGAGAAAIYYNPANISEITESRFSLSVSLVSIDMYNVKNALGNDIDLNRTKFTAQPRFVSYLIELKKNKRISMEIAFMNVANSNVRFTYAEDREMDILKDINGDERYFANYNQENIYRDDYFGIGASYTINENLSIGSSIFVSAKTVRTLKELELDATPLKDSVYRNNELIASYTATYNRQSEVRFQNYSLLFKLGINYRIRNMNVGLNITTPSMDLFSGGKFLHMKRQQSNISKPDGEGYLPDYTVVDQQGKDDFKIRIKTPFSVSLGATFHSPSVPDKSFFITAEYFSTVSSYSIVDAQEYQYFTPPIANPDSGNLMDFSYGARDILNFAIGYRWHISQKLLLLSGFKTDFNYLKNVEIESNRLDNFNINLYHITSGLRFSIKNNVVLFGIQYSFGSRKDIKQIVNIANPVEYNIEEGEALQGARSNDMKVSFHGLSFFLGATFNFSGDK